MVIYGWNHDGTKLLFGRGFFNTSGELSKSTQLWVYDLTAGKLDPLVDSTKVWSASWSPVDDRVAHCEYGNVLSVISLDGKVFSRHENVICDFTWSPDGTGIALAYSSHDMVLSDGSRTTALAVWWLDKDELQLLSDAKYSDDAFPIWSMDMQRILFHRSFSELSEDKGINGLYIVEINDRKTIYLSDGPINYPENLSRSPRSDTLAYRLGKEIYVLKFDGKPVLIGEGTSPVWLPDGNTIIFRSSNSELMSYQMSINLVDRVMGGGQSSVHVHLPQDYLFFSEDY